MSSERPTPRRWTVVPDAVRTQLWPLPAAAVVLAVIAGAGLPRLDSSLDDGWLTEHSDILFGGGPDAARSVLAAIAGSLITVTALTFSLTVVTLQLASSQFSPRLLRTFTTDRVVQGTLALFLATFVYSLTVLRTVRSQDAGQAEFVPQLSVTIAYVLAVASVLALVGFLAHLVREIRVDTMLRNVHHEASLTLAAALPTGDDDSQQRVPQVPPTADRVMASASGFLTAVDDESLLDAAVRAGACVMIDRAPGSSLVEGTPVARVWANGGSALSGDRLAGLRDAVAAALGTGFERTSAQDIGFGLRQLTDVAVKSLSPGINDPTTAIHALGHSSALLCELAARDPGPRVLDDDDGIVRVVLAGPDLADLLDLAVSQPRRYGAAEPQVLARLFTLLAELAWSTDRPEHRRDIARQLTRLRGTAAGQDFDEAERVALARLDALAQDALDGRWAP